MTTQPGWYDDPGAPGTGQLRWWDGQAWTEHVHRPAPAPAVAPAPAQAPPAQGPAQYPVYGYQGAPGAGVPAYVKPTHTPDGAPLANVWLRLAARIIDGLITGLVLLLVSLPFLPRMIGAYLDYFEKLDQAAINGTTPDPFELYGDPDFYQPYLWITLIGVLLALVYFVGFHRFWGATPGKMMLGLQVRPWDRPGPPGWGACFLRWGVEAVGGLLCSGIFNLIDALWCLWDERRQTLHDKAARTVVVSRR